MKKVFKSVKTKDTAYLFSAPNGVPGDITRPDQTSVEPVMLVAVSTVYATYGAPVKYTTGGVEQFNGGAETAADFAGVLIREAPSIGLGASDVQLSPNLPYPPVPQGMAVRGYVSVVCARGTPARGGIVYIQIIANGGVAVGAFAASADGGNTVALSAAQAEWASDGLDAAGNAELRIAR
jgi:hypothetical protein